MKKWLLFALLLVPYLAVDSVRIGNAVDNANDPLAVHKWDNPWENIFNVTGDILGQSDLNITGTIRSPYIKTGNTDLAEELKLAGVESLFTGLVSISNSSAYPFLAMSQGTTNTTSNAAAVVLSYGEHDNPGGANVFSVYRLCNLTSSGVCNTGPLAGFGDLTNTMFPNEALDINSDWTGSSQVLRVNGFFLDPSMPVVYLANIATSPAIKVDDGTMVCPNLNADMVDGYSLDQDLTTLGNPSFSTVTATSFYGKADNATYSDDSNLLDGYDSSEFAMADDIPTRIFENETWIMQDLHVGGQFRFNDSSVKQTLVFDSASSNITYVKLPKLSNILNATVTFEGNLYEYSTGNLGILYNKTFTTGGERITKSSVNNSILYISGDGTSANTRSFNIIDISNPLKPTYIKNVTSLNSGWYPDVYSYTINSDEYLAIATAFLGIKIYNVTNKLSPAYLGTYTYGTQVYGFVASETNSSIIYSIGDDGGIYSVKMLDISNPVSISLISNYTIASATGTISVCNGYVIVPLSGTSASTNYVFNETLGYITTFTTGVSRGRCYDNIYYSGTISTSPELYAHTFENVLSGVNLTDTLSFPGSYRIGLDGARKIDNYLYVPVYTTTSGGLMVVDITDPYDISMYDSSHYYGYSATDSVYTIDDLIYTIGNYNGNPYPFMIYRTSNYPNNVTLDTGDDGNIDYTYLGELNTTISFDLNVTAINDFLQVCDTESDFCDLPLNVTSESEGNIDISKLTVLYDADIYARDVYASQYYGKNITMGSFDDPTDFNKDSGIAKSISVDNGIFIFPNEFYKRDLIDLDKIWSWSVGAIKEYAWRIGWLEGNVTALKAENEMLKQRLDKICKENVLKGCVV